MKSRNYLEVRKERLKDPQEAAAYLDAALNYENEEGFMLALRTVAEVYGISNVARETGLGRESLYKTLNEDGNPKLRTLKAVLDTLGIRIAFEPNKEPPPVAHAIEARERSPTPYAAAAHKKGQTRAVRGKRGRGFTRRNKTG